MATNIKYCKSCADHKVEHTFQDNLYGKYIRLFNVGAKSETCTVCANGKIDPKTKK